MIVNHENQTLTPSLGDRQSACACRLSDAILNGDRTRSPEVEAHLAVCPECRSAVERWEKIESRLALPPRPAPSWEALEKRILIPRGDRPESQNTLWDLFERLRLVCFPADNAPSRIGQPAFAACLVLLLWIGLRTSFVPSLPSSDLKREFLTASIQRIQEFGRLQSAPSSPPGLPFPR